MQTDESDSTDDASEPKGFYGKFVGFVSAGFPKIFRDAFKGFGLNCTDDITVNTANVIGKTGAETFFYLLGNAVGLITMIVGAWWLYRLIQHFAKNYARWFHRVRACGIWFAAFLIFRSALAA